MSPGSPGQERVLRARSELCCVCLSSLSLLNSCLQSKQCVLSPKTAGWSSPFGRADWKPFTLKSLQKHELQVQPLAAVLTPAGLCLGPELDANAVVLGRLGRRT